MIFTRCKILWQKGRQIISFSLVGITNTLVDFAMFTLVHGLAGFNLLFSQIFAYSCGVMNSYLLNRIWTFRVKKPAGIVEIIRFILVNMVSLGLSTAVLYAGSHYFDWNVYLAKLLATVTAMIINYLGFKRFVFVH